VKPSTTELARIAERLFSSVMAPLVLGGDIRPGHAIGSLAALALGSGREPADRELAVLVEIGRVRRSRRLAAVDAMPGPSAAEWALAAAFHDILQSANPWFYAALRRDAAPVILERARETLERIAAPASVGEALSRHSWFDRVMEVTRADTRVTFWAGYRTFRGVAPPTRLVRWARLRRVSVTRTPVRVLDLGPLAVEREHLRDAVHSLLARTPLTDLATCTRDAPSFEWQKATLSLLAARGGRTLALRALDRLDPGQVEAALGRATRHLLCGELRSLAAPAIALLGERTLAESLRCASGRTPSDDGGEDSRFARALGAVAAERELATGGDVLTTPERERMADVIARAARTPSAREARAMLEG
jgi:hypothetical protein